MNSFEDEFGKIIECTHVGSVSNVNGVEDNLVLECNFDCDSENGYFYAPGNIQNSVHLDCKGQGEWLLETFMLCEQGCSVLADTFANYKGYSINCEAYVSEGWYKSCTFTCDSTTGYVANAEGDIGESDILYCRLGVFDLSLSKMQCKSVCTKDSDCPTNIKCVQRQDTENVYFCDE